MPPRIFFKHSFVISTFSCFVTLISLCKFFNHFASLLWSTDSLHTSLQNTFSILHHLGDHHHIFLLPDSIPYNCLWLFWNTPFCLNLSTFSIYLLALAAIATSLCFHSSITMLNVFTLILYFLSNVCQYLTLLTSLYFDDSNWLKSFLSSLILFCNLLLYIGFFLSDALWIFIPNLFVRAGAPA